MMLTNRLLPLYLAGSVVLSCTDDGKDDVDAGGLPGTDAGPIDEPEPPAPPTPDAAVSGDAAVPGAPDAAVPGTPDASTPGAPDAAVADAGAGMGGPDASFHVPDGGVVLRPAELPFDEAYLERLNAPDGFEIDVYAEPGGQTRMLAVFGHAVYVTRPMEGDVLRLADDDADGIAESQLTATAGWPTIHGIVFDGEDVYLATPKELLRGVIGDDGGFTDLEVVVDDLPDGGQHALRTLGIGPDGRLYVSVGSSCGACAETNPEHATLLRFAENLGSRNVFASGLRNTIGFGWHPETRELWGMDNGSDWRGNELPPEELNRIEMGKNYGWPYCFDDRVDPIISDPPDQTKEEYCEGTEPPVATWQAHEAPIGLSFYDSTAFPPDYQGDAFVAMHGSWNRAPATGYSVVRVDFEEGAPVGIETFVDGFLADDGLSTFGRPAGIVTHPDGSLLFSDDTNGVIYRVTRQVPTESDAGSDAGNP